MEMVDQLDLSDATLVLQDWGGNHFLQQDLPEEYSEFLVNWLKDTD